MKKILFWILYGLYSICISGMEEKLQGTEELKNIFNFVNKNFDISGKIVRVDAQRKIIEKDVINKYGKKDFYRPTQFDKYESNDKLCVTRCAVNQSSLAMCFPYTGFITQESALATEIGEHIKKSMSQREKNQALKMYVNYLDKYDTYDHYRTHCLIAIAAGANITAKLIEKLAFHEDYNGLFFCFQQKCFLCRDTYKPLLFFAKNKYVAQLMIAFGVPVTQVSNQKETVLMHLATDYSKSEQHIKLFKYYLKCGVDINYCNKDEDSLLHILANELSIAAPIIKNGDKACMILERERGAITVEMLRVIMQQSQIVIDKKTISNRSPLMSLKKF